MSDELFMRRALDLAKLGIGMVSPNPMVGCVIVCDGKIIGEGYHQKYGESHAEVNAIASVSDQNMLEKSTAYVTLEPCSHFGKTPPCADLIIEKKIRKVVVCNQDPNPLVAGKGLQKIKEAGIAVEVGLMESEGLELNKRFFTYHEKKRPYVILKWAQTADGFIARENFDSKWISNAQSRQLVHKWRAEEAAIMVGTNTAKYDNPELTVRDWVGKNPVRVVIDRKLALNSALKLFDGLVPTLVFTEKEHQSSENIEYIHTNRISASSILEALYERRIQSVLIEGGAALINVFIKENFWDEARVFTSQKTFDIGISAPTISNIPDLEEDVAGDKLQIFKNK